MNVQLNDSGVPILKEKTLAQKIKSFLLWTILVIMTLAAALLVYLCVAGANEMAALTTLKKVSSHPYYTMTYDSFDYSDLMTKELGSNDEIIKFYKEKFFKGLSGMFPGGCENDYITRGSLAFSSRSSTVNQVRGRIYNSYHTPVMMVIAKPENGYKSWNLIDLADVGIPATDSIDQWYGNAFQTVAANYCVSEGINSEFFGVSLISCPVAECTDTSKVNITPFMAVRMMLDRVATVASALDLLDDYDIDFSSGSYHFFISDKEGNSAVIEYVNGKMSVTNRASGTHHQVCTNKMEDETLRASEKDYSNRFNEISNYKLFDDTLNNMYSVGTGIDRSYATLLLNDKSEPFTETTEEHFGTNLYGTQYAVTYDALKMKIYLVIGGDTKSQSYTYDID